LVLYPKPPKQLVVELEPAKLSAGEEVRDLDGGAVACPLVMGGDGVF